MKRVDCTELEWLAARLRSVADDLARAAQLLGAAGDIERAEARLAAIARPPQLAPPASGTATASSVVGRASATVAARELVATSVEIEGTRQVAVFDHDRRTSRLVDRQGKREVSEIPF